MREETIAAFLVGQMDAAPLNSEALQSIRRHDEVRTAIAITDMHRPFALSRVHVIRLCDAAIEGSIEEDALNAIAFALIATDHFEWEDDIIAEVLADWSAPEINYPLTPATISMHRSWLAGEANPPKMASLSKNRAEGKLVSQRLKVDELRPDWASYSEILRNLEF